MVPNKVQCCAGNCSLSEGTACKRTLNCKVMQSRMVKARCPEGFAKLPLCVCLHLHLPGPYVKHPGDKSSVWDTGFQLFRLLCPIMQP